MRYFADTKSPFFVPITGVERPSHSANQSNQVGTTTKNSRERKSIGVEKSFNLKSNFVE